MTRQLNLVCDGRVIDKIKCRRRPTSPPSHVHLEESLLPNPDNNNGTDNDFGGRLYALNTRKRAKQNYVFMSSPCSNAIPPSCENEDQDALVRPLASEANIDENLEYDVVDHDEEVGGEDDGEDDNNDDEENDDGGDDDDYENVDESAVDGRLEATDNDGRHHRHHKQKPGNQQPLKRPRHPYKDLCIAKGHFCGSRMFGCRFQRTALYDCQAVGAKPLVRLVDAKVCGGSREDSGEGSSTSGGGSTSEGGGSTTSGGNGTDPQDPCKCTPGTSATNITPICGSHLPTRCNIEPNAIYFCPHGPGSKFELLHICQPGTQCRTRSGADPVCGASTCDCTGSNQLCADQFPDNCPGISKNTAYKCSFNGGKVEMVRECASDRTCVSVSGGTLCASNDCACPVDGTACGEIFPLRCRIPTTALYRCVKGEAPVLMQNCAPGRCSAAAGSTTGSAIAMAASSVDFEGLANNDCVDSCRCTSPGTVRCCLFRFAMF